MHILLKINLFTLMLLLSSASFAVDAIINIDDLSYKKIGEEFNLSTGITVSNSDQEKYIFELSLEQSYERELIHDDQSISYDFDFDNSLDLEVNNVYKNFGLVHHSEAKISTNSDSFKNTKDFTITPIGIKYEFEQNYFNQINFSLHPQLNHGEFTSTTFDENTFEEKEIKSRETRWYYSLRLKTELTFLKDKVSYSTDSWYRNSPDYFDTSSTNEKKLRVSTKHEITYAMNQYISFGYRVEVDYDKRRLLEQQLPKTDVENGFTLQISF